MACGAAPRVVRVYDGRIVEGRYVSPDAYAAFLRGVLAEESGDLRGALAGYTQAWGEDGDDPEIAARIGEARCTLDPKDGEADRAFAKALALDPASASALAAKGRCALARGQADEAASLARRAASLDPDNVALEAFAVRAEASQGDAAARAGASRGDAAARRERAIALTDRHGDRAEAWDALVAWGRSRRDAELVARGLEGLVHAAPARSAEAEKGALALLQGGQPALARKVAAAIADAPRALGVIGPRDPTVARIAVDEAIAREDKPSALARATRGHVPLAEVAARALLLGWRAMAASVATSLVDADPHASGAAMVVLALKEAGGGLAVGGGVAGPLAIEDLRDPPPELCALVFAHRLAIASGPEIARAWLARVTRTPMPARDPLGGPLAVDLATRGVLPVIDLPAELRASAQRARALE